MNHVFHLTIITEITINLNNLTVTKNNYDNI